MSPLFHLLESFYRRQLPLGVAFVGSAKLGVSLGKPLGSEPSAFEGFMQVHSEYQSLSTYTSYFGWGKVLVAQFEFQEEYPPPDRSWLAFARLAALVQRYLDNPDEFREPPGSKVPVLKPYLEGPRLRSLGAEALFDKPGQ